MCIVFVHAPSHHIQKMTLQKIIVKTLWLGAISSKCSIPIIDTIFLQHYDTFLKDFLFFLSFGYLITGCVIFKNHNFS